MRPLFEGPDGVLNVEYFSCLAENRGAWIAYRSIATEQSTAKLDQEATCVARSPKSRAAYETEAPAS
jgi:hypothetical protein